MNQDLNIVILAAGQGKRMNSTKPKVLHAISAKPMLQHVIETALLLSPQKLIVVYGHGGEQVQNAMEACFGNQLITWAHQAQQLGTGHALKSAVSELSASGRTLVLYGDVPLISQVTLEKMLAVYAENIVMLSDVVDNPFGYGRVIHNADQQICGIVEEKDTDSQQKLINEINTGFYVLPNAKISGWLNALSNNNSQGEYYLTDVVELAYKDGITIEAVFAANHYEVMGVNNSLQLEELERIYQLNKVEELMRQGITVADKKRLDLRGKLTVGKDCMIDINCIFDGEVVLGNNVTIGAGCILKNVTIADNVTIKPYSLLEDAEVGAGAQIGPYSRLRPGAKLAEDVHVGNFVEIKKSLVGKGSKVNHLTYIGDAEIGSKVNVGAGSVTCNYDGVNKFTTTIKDNVFVGSGTMMVAPVVINEGSVIGAGSVITKDTEAHKLTVARARQVTSASWTRPTKK